MKIDILHHDTPTHLQARPGDAIVTSRNLDPLMHPFARARERMRALNAAKMERMFAKPFIASLEGHVDSVTVMSRMPGALSVVASASHDGGIILHDLSLQQHRMRISTAHKGKISGLCFADPDRLLSCGTDKNVRMWHVNPSSDTNDSVGNISEQQPLNSYPGKVPFNSIDHHHTKPLFATASTNIQIWDQTRTAPILNLTFPTSTETIDAIRFNSSESSILASVGSDRTMTLYDIRTGKAERRLVLQMRANCISWSPTFPTTILLGSEDHNLYTFDIRSLATPTQIYKAHMSAVISCDWSPTGTEFVSGGWDRTVRVWEEGIGKQPEIYHSKRMQRVISTIFTADARFVLSGSDDGNVRLWKAKANDRLGVVAGRERTAIEYRESLKQRWKMDSEIAKIQRTRHLPKAIKSASSLKRTMLDARAEKEERRRRHTRAGDSKPKAERKKVVIVEQT